MVRWGSRALRVPLSLILTLRLEWTILVLASPELDAAGVSTAAAPGKSPYASWSRRSEGTFSDALTRRPVAAFIGLLPRHLDMKVKLELAKRYLLLSISI